MSPLLTFKRQQDIAQAIPGLVVIFLASLLVVIRPVSDLSGDYAFLTLTLTELYFFPSASSPIQLETALLALLGGTLSLGYCQLWLYFAVLANTTGSGFDGGEGQRETPGARASVAIGLTILALASGYVRSSSPRLDNASRIALFHGVWTLTDASDVFVMSSTPFLRLFYPTIFAASTSILSTFLGSIFWPYERREVRDAFEDVLDGVAGEVEWQVGLVLGGSDENGPQKGRVVGELVAGGERAGDIATAQDPEAGTSSQRTSPLFQSPTEGTTPTPRKQIDISLSELSDLHSAARHSIVLSPLPPGKLGPVLRVLIRRVGRNTVARGGGAYVRALEGSRAGMREGSKGTGRSSLSNGNSNTEDSSTRSIDPAVRALERDTRNALEQCKIAVADIYGWGNRHTPARHGSARGFVPYLLGLGAKRDRRGLSPDVANMDRKAATAKEGDVPSKPPDTGQLPRASPTERLARGTHILQASIKSFRLDLVLWMERDFPGTEQIVTPYSGPSRVLSTSSRESSADRGRSGERARSDHERTLSWTGLGIDRTHAFKSRTRREGSAHDRIQMAAWLVAMLDLAKDVLQLMDATQQLCALAPPHRSMLWIPRLNMEWLRKRHHQSANSTHAEMISRDVPGAGNLESSSANAEEKEDAREREKLSANIELAVRRRLDRDPTPREDNAPLRKRILRSVRTPLSHWWNSERLLRGRIRLSRRLSALRRSRHVRYAIKLAMGVMLLSIPGLLPIGTAGRTWYANARVQWAVISYLYVLDLTTGTTFKIGVVRVIATCGTAIAAYVAWLISRGNAYGLVVMTSVLNVPIVYLRLFTRYPVAGVVGGITYPPILYIAYLDNGNSASVVNVALLRAAEIALGVVAAFLINTLIFPYHARVKYYNVFACTLDDIGSLYLSMSKQNLRSSLVYSAHNESYLQQDYKIEKGLIQCRSLAVIQHMELSLLPKPHDLHENLNRLLSEIYETMVEIRTLRSSIPRRETVLDVISQRQELVSSIYIVLFAVGHAARSFTPLPQFLPSPSVAVQRYSDAIESHIRQSRSNSKYHSSPTSASSPVMDELRQLELAVLYAYAEREALFRLCAKVDELLAIGKDLVGQQSFLDPTALCGQSEASNE